MRRFERRGTSLLILGLLIAVGCGEDGPNGPPPSQVIVPEAWRGLWRITYTAYTCVGDSLIDVSEDTRPACPGQTLEQFLGIESQDVDLTCNGEFTDTDLTARCTGQTDVLCTLFITADLNATRADSLFSGTALLRTTLDCGGDTESDCESYTIEGVRIDPSPPICPDSVTALAPALTRFLERSRPESLGVLR